jgi:protein SCO1/2
MSIRHSLCALLAAFALAGCDARKHSAETMPEAVTYEVRGTLKEVRQDGHRGLVAHERIPGYMEAMTMEFEAPNAPEFAGLVPGDTLLFRLTVAEGKGRVDHVRKTGHVKAPLEVAPQPPAPGTFVPDVTLEDQRGQALRLNELRERALAITFIETRCTLPEACVRMSERFAEVQVALTGVGGRDAWHLVSVSIDPRHDKADRLADYARQYSADPRRWTFATGKYEEVEKFCAFFGVPVVREGAQPEHKLHTVVVDPGGRVRRVFVGHQWTATDLAAEMKRALGVP